MEKKFDLWIDKKKELHYKKREAYFRQRQIWWCSLGVNVGFEQDGKNSNFERPVLIVKKWNTRLCWVVPLTSVQRKGSFFHPISYLDATYTLVLCQLRILSSKRLLRKIRTISNEEFIEIKKVLRQSL